MHVQPVLASSLNMVVTRHRIVHILQMCKHIKSISPKSRAALLGPLGNRINSTVS